MNYNERIEELKKGNLQERLSKIQEFAKNVSEDLAKATLSTTAAVYGWSRGRKCTPMKEHSIAEYFGETEENLF
jgi:hypothetical protein